MCRHCLLFARHKCKKMQYMTFLETSVWLSASHVLVFLCPQAIASVCPSDRLLICLCSRAWAWGRVRLQADERNATVDDNTRSNSNSWVGTAQELLKQRAHWQGDLCEKEGVLAYHFCVKILPVEHSRHDWDFPRELSAESTLIGRFQRKGSCAHHFLIASMLLCEHIENGNITWMLRLRSSPCEEDLFWARVVGFLFECSNRDSACMIF